MPFELKRREDRPLLPDEVQALKASADALGALVDDAGYATSSRPGYCFLLLRQEVWDAAVKAREETPGNPKYPEEP
jgi:hypothetical protein